MNKRILIIDDEETVRELLVKVFKQAGFESYSAADSHDALEMISQTNFQVFFIDLSMPGMSGIELVRILRKEMPVSFFFAMTGFTSVYDLVRCREAGFDDYFSKPLDLKQITDCVNEAFVKIDRWRQPGKKPDSITL